MTGKFGPGPLLTKADEFQSSGRRSLARTLLGVFGGRGLSQTEEDVDRRYRAVAGQLWRAACTLGEPILCRFIEAEAPAQREVLIDTVNRVRIAGQRAG